MKTFLRGFGAVLAGMFAWAILWLASNAGLNAAFPASYAEDGSTSSSGLLLTLLLLSVVYSVLAGWLTAIVASQKILLHTLILGGVQLAIGIAVQIEYWDVMPLWYHIPFLALLLPGNVVGGFLHRSR